MVLEDLYQSKVNISAAIFGTAVIIGLTRLSSLLPPYYYFTYEEFILDPNASKQLVSIIAKLVIPLFAGLLVGYIWRSDSKIAAGVAGFSAPFLMLWPFLTDWYALAPESIKARFNTFVFLYALYIVASAYLTRTGALLGLYLSGALKVSIVSGQPIVVSMSDVVSTAAKGLVVFVVERVLQKLAS
jgi:hypothetical protein